MRRVFKRVALETRSKLDSLLEPAMPLEQRLELEAPPALTARADAPNVGTRVRQREWVSAFHELRVDSSQPGLESVNQQIAKLNRIRSLQLPAQLFQGVPESLVKRWRQRASLEAPRELERHRSLVRFALMTALCVQRHAELTDALVDHLI